MQSGKVIAIRREDQSVWERRASFSPVIVKKLIKQGVKVIVQPSNRRAYPMQVSIRTSYCSLGIFCDNKLTAEELLSSDNRRSIALLKPDSRLSRFPCGPSKMDTNCALVNI